jgi:hypothetical protein
MVTGRVTPPGRSPKSSTASDRRAGDDPAAVETAPPPASPYAEDLPELHTVVQRSLPGMRGSTFREALLGDPKLAIDVVDRLALFLTILTGKVDGFLHQDARRRVIRVLARHRDLFFSDPPVLSRAHLPGLVGTSREMTGRVIRDLERDGVVARVGRTGLRLLDATPLDEEPVSAP